MYIHFFIEQSAHALLKTAHITTNAEYPGLVTISRGSSTPACIPTGSKYSKSYCPGNLVNNQFLHNTELPAAKAQAIICTALPLVIDQLQYFTL